MRRHFFNIDKSKERLRVEEQTKTAAAARQQYRQRELAQIARQQTDNAIWHQSMRVLLEGVCGINQNLIERETGVARPSVKRFMSGLDVEPETVMKLAMFIWRRLNVAVLLSDEDFDGR